ncbi:helix-turn-helix domain-containing protein, partial [Actinocorallia lasiicapitis]
QWAITWSRLAELLKAVVDAAEVGGAPLFAGWRAVPLPDDGHGRVLQLTHVLRELRGGLHFLATKAAGVGPLQAVLISGSPLAAGPDQARVFGWREPFEEITPELQDRWTAAEARTDELIAPAFAALTPAELDELEELLGKAHATAFAR